MACPLSDACYMLQEWANFSQEHFVKPLSARRHPTEALFLQNQQFSMTPDRDSKQGCVYICYRFLCLFMFLDLSDFHLKLMLYTWELSRDDGGLVQDIFQSMFGLGNDLKNMILIKQHTFSLVQTSMFENVDFDCSSKTQRLNH